MKRRIDIATLKGVTISKYTHEFVIHGTDYEYDYYYVSDKKKNIIEAIAESYLKLKDAELDFCEMDSKSLKTVVTLKSEKKKNVTFSRMPQQGLISVGVYLYGDTTNSKTDTEDEGRVRKPTIWVNDDKYKDARLEDFMVIKTIGRGSFGKVSLVKHKKTGKAYAMKTLKKDLLINQDQIENTLLEKTVLTKYRYAFLVGLEFCFQTEDRIYFVMQFVPGGELFEHLRKFRIFDEEK